MHNSKARSYVIQASVEVEHSITFFLAKALCIDVSKSDTLGSKSGCISFDQKLRLLADTEFINPTERNKLKTFAEIRNKFAHILEVSDFTRCFNLVKGVSNLDKWYNAKKEIDSNTEDGKKALYVCLYNDIINILSNSIAPKITQNVIDDLANKINFKFNQKIRENLLGALKENPSQTEFIAEILSKSITNDKEIEEIKKQISFKYKINF